MSVVTRIQLEGIPIDVTRKKIKNMHLRVHPPEGAVRISAPTRMAMATIHDFALSKLDWIRAQQLNISQQPPPVQNDFVDGEHHYFSGKTYVLRVVEKRATPGVSRHDSELVLQVRPGSDSTSRGAVLDAWYREQLKLVLESLTEYWQQRLGVRVSQIKVRKMKTRWGSCTPGTGAIRMNLELAKKPPQCLEYVLVHELVHLLEPGHSRRFWGLMDEFLPNWRVCREELNHCPLGP